MLISLGFMEKQTRISIRCNFIPMSLAKFRSLTRSPIRDIVDQWVVRCKLVQSIQKIVWHYLANLNTHIPSNPVIAFPAIHAREMLALGTCVPETYIRSEQCLQQQKHWQQPNRSPTEKQINKLYIHTIQHDRYSRENEPLLHIMDKYQKHNAEGGKTSDRRLCIIYTVHQTSKGEQQGS